MEMFTKTKLLRAAKKKKQQQTNIWKVTTPLKINIEPENDALVQIFFLFY